jgi:hypothetical protein
LLILLGFLFAYPVEGSLCLPCGGFFLPTLLGVLFAYQALSANLSSGVIFAYLFIAMATCLFNLSYLPVARFLPTVLAFSLQWRQLSLPCCGVPSAYLTVASSLPTLLLLGVLSTYLSVASPLPV